MSFGHALLVRGDPATGLAAWLGTVLGMKEYGAFLIESPEGGRSRATLAWAQWGEPRGALGTGMGTQEVVSPSGGGFGGSEPRCATWGQRRSPDAAPAESPQTGSARPLQLVLSARGSSLGRITAIRDLGFQPVCSYASLHRRVYPSRWPPFPRPEDFSGSALEPMLSSPHAPEPSGGSSFGHCVLQVPGECQGLAPACT